ncbi:hypothetical protein AAHA92_22445 [Salvia divinorum]|uniref:Uncharacterized protein n=1 Tax=Salvia divinorum TaxID=28513 RepID=A0ABD1GNP7_SALDI
MTTIALVNFEIPIIPFKNTKCTRLQNHNSFSSFQSEDIAVSFHSPEGILRLIVVFISCHSLYEFNPEVCELFTAMADLKRTKLSSSWSQDTQGSFHLGRPGAPKGDRTRRSCGVGFNPNGNKIECDDDQWDQIVKAWLHWESWKVVFGKDRRTGVGAEDIPDAVNELSSQQNLDDMSLGNNYNVNLEDIPVNDPADDAFPQETGGVENTSHNLGVTTAHKITSKKRKNEAGMNDLLLLLGKMNDDTNARLEGLSLRNACKEVYKLLGHLPELTQAQKFDASEIILDKVKKHPGT